MLSRRRLTVCVPRAVRAAGPGAPPANLVILHDGQNLFEPDRAYIPGQTWQVAETADALIERGAMPPTIIAGVDHLGERRLKEFGGRASGYGHFVVDEVLPYLRQNYHVKCDAAGTVMGGSSMGALITMRIAMRYPATFGALLVFSPSVWWKDRAILRAIRRPSGLARFLRPSHARGLGDDVRVWLSIGEGEDESAVQDARQLRDTLLDVRRGDASRLHYFEDPEGGHNEKSWAKQLGPALEFVLGQPR